jgi:small-conductance mechanosensitive channel
MSGVFQGLSARNDLTDYLSAALLLLIIWAVAAILRRALSPRVLARFGPFATAFEKALVESVLPGLRFGAFFFAFERLLMPRPFHRSVHIYGAAVLTIALVRLAVVTVRFWMVEDWPRRHADGKGVESQFKTFMPVVQIGLWVAGLVLLADNLGMRVSTVVAGLGIGGVAIALASQALLGDLFSYFAILLDRPFDIGDFIVIEGCMGTVESIGIKTTRLRSLTGEQLVLSNTDLTKSRLRNLQRMSMRRVEFKLTVSCETPVERLKGMPAVVRSLVEGLERTRFERAHIAGITPAGIDFEIVYFVETGDYNLYMDVQHALWLGLKAECDHRGLSLANRNPKLVFDPPRPAAVVTTGDAIFPPHADSAA